jgi:HicB family
VTIVTRVDFELDDELHRRAKAAAGFQGVSLKVFVEQALDAAVVATEASTSDHVKGRAGHRRTRREATNPEGARAMTERLRLDKTATAGGVWRDNYLSVPNLRRVAKAEGVSLPAGSSKQGIVAALVAAGIPNDQLQARNPLRRA